MHLFEFLSLFLEIDYGKKKCQTLHMQYIKKTEEPLNMAWDKVNETCLVSSVHRSSNDYKSTLVDHGLTQQLYDRFENNELPLNYGILQGINVYFRTFFETIKWFWFDAVSQRFYR